MGTPANENQGRARWRPIEIVGLCILVFALGMLLFDPKSLGDFFNAMFQKAKPIVVNVFLTGDVGVCIIVSVMIGRILERLGLTDALIRVFVPIAYRIGVHPAVVIPGVYNIIGDINAAGRIAGPVLKESGATKDDQKIAVATMIQSQQSFSTFTLGLLAMTTIGIKAFPIVMIGIFLPLVITPLILKLTIYKNTQRVTLEKLPYFTPKTPFLTTVFGGAREGAELLFLLIIPAVAVVYAFIGALDFVGMWKPIETGLTALLTKLSIDAQTGILSVLASPTAAMGMLVKSAPTIKPNLVVGSFLLAASGLPLSVISGQIPAIWSKVSDLSEKEALQAALVGLVIRVITAAILAIVLTPLCV